MTIPMPRPRAACQARLRTSSVASTAASAVSSVAVGTSEAGRALGALRNPVRDVSMGQP